MCNDVERQREGLLEAQNNCVEFEDERDEDIVLADTLAAGVDRGGKIHIANNNLVKEQRNDTSFTDLWEQDESGHGMSVGYGILFHREVADERD